MIKPKKWHDTYPQGTKQGDDEQKFFIALARHPKWIWRSTAALSKETGLTKERIEEIIVKYFKKNMVFQNPQNEDQWGYWENVPDMVPKEEDSITNEDHKTRIKNASN